MRHRHEDGRRRHAKEHDDQHRDGQHRDGGHRDGHRRHRRGGGRRGGRHFDYGELRLLVLAMISEEPRHGYELIKAIEERFAGSYTPSPGVIYPTLSWLDDMGYAAVQLEESNRKRYRITEEGEAFLIANRTAADELLSRTGPDGESGPADPVPDPVIRGMENLKLAMRLRMRQGPISPEAAETIAAALDAAALAVEKSR